MVISRTFNGFEKGPIRPPSEARSLLIRLTRNCPWNKCTFCPVYKGTKFSIRYVEDVKADIDTIFDISRAIKELSFRMGYAGEVTDNVARRVFSGGLGLGEDIKYIAFWLYNGGKNVFLQDANSLIMKPSDLLEILAHLKERFPDIDRITTYARSATVARMKLEDLKMLKEAGLTRVHIGFESGSDNVLEFVKKGTTAKQHVLGGRNVVDAGLELSEYVMPGLGGREWTHEHAVESARVLNQIDPHFIRIRSLHVHEIMPLMKDIEEGRFSLLSDDETAREIRLFVENLEGIESHIVSDHILNLLEEVEGKLPEDKEKMLGVIDSYLELDDDDRLLYRIGRRAGFMRSTRDLLDIDLRERAERVMNRLRASAEGDIEGTLRGLMNSYI
ncbi:MAG: radical SAM protein [Deltaproteobacteria bacterium]|uniref:Radical SAM protein n=1 Tax=Candidatus Zymogenus saltonus TaxID=2844893 RepID=A0A9D8KFH9_9DELT|nr:radical SAM protein [Candidatus Zymogenus saltonus]